MTDERPPDYILCVNYSALDIPSEKVKCFFCGCDLTRSLTSPKVRPVCMSCISLLDAEVPK